MLSFTKPTSNQDGEESAPAEEATAAGPVADAALPEASSLFAKTEQAPAPVEAAYEPAVRSQIQRVRLDLLSRETERLEQQLRQVLDQQSEDRQLREELRGQIAQLNQRIEGLLAGGASKSAGPGSADGDLRTAVKPLLEAVMQMLDSADAAGLSESPPPAGSSEAWAQVDAARREPLPSTTPPSAAEIPVEPTPEAAAASEAEIADATGGVGEPETLNAPAPDLPEADAMLAPAADPEEDLDPDPEAELRIEIARLLRPKKAGGGYEPLGPQASPRAQRAAAELAPTPSPPSVEPTVAESAVPSPPPAAARDMEPQPLLLGTEETPAVDKDLASKSHTTDLSPEGVVDSTRALSRDDGSDSVADGRKSSSDEPKADSDQGDLRGGGALPKSQRPSWAPRPNPMRASLPKCLTEPWEEPSHRPGGRWPFRRVRPAGRRNDPSK